ncbi:MAG: AAA domain-containing protein [Candidatus Aegiribacteria sp.]|nr:AAA domain-containing protein [Candidatus Aegiribacteria sp.]MBD3294476.1 AAA domain-containing protein [Candidatus Fermentibacteria bacterium]
MLSDVISRNRIRSDTEEVVFRHRGEVRIGRSFRYFGRIEDVDHLLRLQKRLSARWVVFPDEKHVVDNETVCLSVSADRLEPFTGKPRSFQQLFRPLDELHGCGMLHLGISQDSYMLRDGECVLMHWGDSLLTSGENLPPELECGGFSSVASDYYLLGSMLSSENCGIWDGGQAPPLKRLKHRSVSRRLEAMKADGGGLPRPILPSGRMFTLVRGGSWERRDQLVNEYICAAAGKGWRTAVIKCRHQESHRPLPGYSTRGYTIRSPEDLVERLFPRTDGLKRLLVVDQIDFTSPDLKALLRVLYDSATSDISVLMTGACSDWMPGEKVYVVNLDGQASAASILEPEEMSEKGLYSGYPCSWGEGLCFRTDEVKTERLDLSPEELFEEGAFRFLVSEEGKKLLGPEHRGLYADSCVETGMLDTALETLEDEDHLRRGCIYEQKGDFQSAKECFFKAVAAGCSKSEIGLPYYRSLAESGERKKAIRELSSADDPEHMDYLSRLLDTEGLPEKSMEVLENALSRTLSHQRIPLLCSKANQCMRLGDYDDALIAVNEASSLASESLDTDRLLNTLTIKGRVLGIMGFWQDALECLQKASVLARDSLKVPVSGYVSILINRYVGEFQMGYLELAACTKKEIESLDFGGGSRRVEQIARQVFAYTGVLMCKGAEGLSALNEALRMAQEVGNTLMKGLCLLYKGKLLAQAGRSSEAVRYLVKARTVGEKLGDQHLMLLSDMTMCYVQEPMENSGLLEKCRELKLKFEELEARVILNRERDEAFDSILDLPAPFKACELATGFGLPGDVRVLNRLMESFRRICSQLKEAELDGFLEAHPKLAELSSGTASGTVAGIHCDLRRQMESVAEWISGYTAGQEDINGLAERFGARVSRTEPGDESEEIIRIESAAGEDYFLSGTELSVLKLLEPVISSAVNICVPTRRKSTDEEHHFPEIVGRSDELKRIKHRIRKIAHSNIPVLITGETGTGKELVAEAVYRASGSRNSFVAVDCGAIPENLIEAELFGSCKGSYTDSHRSRMGLIEAADEGTLFLDEIGNMPLHLQAKLLRVLETGSFRRLGESGERNVNFRLISATNSDLASKVGNGQFRPDLYYRIAVMVIEVPPLRERISDIPLLVRHFASDLSEGENRTPRILKTAMNKLCGYAWPGNVRELRNVVQRSLLLSDGKVIRESDICIRNGPGGSSGELPGAPQTLEDAMAWHVYRNFRKFGTKVKTAEVLQCDPKTVYKYVKIYTEKNET